MKARLPIIGQVKTGKDAEDVEVAAVAKEINSLGQSFFQTFKALSDEKTVSTKLLEANKEWVYRNNDVIAEEVSQVDFVLYRIGLQGGKINFKEVENHPLLDLLDRFNDQTTKKDAVYNTQSHKKLTGDAFWYLDKNGKQINNIFLLQPDKVELDIGDPTDSSDTLVEGYKYKETIDGEYVEKYYTPDEIIHFKAPNPGNMFRGKGAAEAAAETIDLDNFSAESIRKYYLQGAITNFVLTTEARLNPDQLKRLKAEMKAAYGGIDNAFKTMILGGGLKPEKLSYNNKEMEMIGQFEWYRDKLMIIFGNTKASLGIIDDVNRASHESSIISWKRNTIKPEIEAIVDTLNEFLVPMFGTDLVLGFEDPVPEDRAAIIDEVKVLFTEATRPVITRNEARKKLGYDEVPGEDELVPLNTPDPTAVPPPLKYVNLKSVLRRNDWYKAKEFYSAAKKAAIPFAKQIIKARKQKSDVQEHSQFTNEQVEKYWKKQIHVVEVLEERFENSVTQFINDLQKIALNNVETEVAQRKKDVTKAIYNEEELLTRAQFDFTPLLMEQIVSAGQQAYNLINVDAPYVPYKVRDAVEANVRKFTSSMLDTDRQILTDIITDGIKEGQSVQEIKKLITQAFEENIKPNQAKRITRTEVIKASNMGAVDAFQQSGIVEGKQWYTAEDDRVDPVCASLNGKTIGLTEKYIKQGEEYMGNTYSYSSIKTPPLHPNCRCVMLPVIKNQKGFVPVPVLEKEIMQKAIVELEAKVDKRTKAFKEIKAKASDDSAYIKSLEGLLGIKDD